MSTKKNKISNQDKTFMKLALNLAKVRHGLTGPNPSVGCVVVKNNEIVSIGQTGFNGTPHAEFNAIKNSTENLQGSIMYVTLEPCSHYGKTPPCTNIIIKNKIKKVVYAVEDIDKKVKGKTLKILRSKNILVKKNLLRKEVNKFYTPYFFNRKNKLPYVTGKIAISKNNLIYSKDTKRISDIHTDKFTHFLRYKNDSLMISSKTLKKDNPKLNCRLEGMNKFSPKRIILDRNLETKKNSHIFKTANKNNTIIFYHNAKTKEKLMFKKKGIILIKGKLIHDGFDIKSILKKLYVLGCRNLLVEGGNDLSKHIVKKKLFNEFYLYKCAKNLSKLVNYKEFNFLNELKKNYKDILKINKKLGKDVITLYK
jgi:diaminohydroxyphosphoribosylaminopyrimidine deaminase/5-amino-6-(5-phosphoribosylamino)uracil reductase